MQPTPLLLHQGHVNNYEIPFTSVNNGLCWTNQIVGGANRQNRLAYEKDAGRRRQSRTMPGAKSRRNVKLPPDEDPQMPGVKHRHTMAYYCHMQVD